MANKSVETFLAWLEHDLLGIDKFVSAKVGQLQTAIHSANHAAKRLQAPENIIFAASRPLADIAPCGVKALLQERGDRDVEFVRRAHVEHEREIGIRAVMRRA